MRLALCSFVIYLHTKQQQFVMKVLQVVCSNKEDTTAKWSRIKLRRRWHDDEDDEHDEIRE